MQSGFDYATEIFEMSKPILKRKQKVLFKKYLLALKYYYTESEKLTLEQKSNIILDDVMLNSIIGKISFKIKHCFDDIYPAQLDKKKVEEASILVDNETNRIRSLIENISTNNYKSNYSEEEIRNILSKTHEEDEINRIISFSKEINKPSNDGDNLMIFRKKDVTLDEIINQETSNGRRHKNNIIVFPKK